MDTDQGGLQQPLGGTAPQIEVDGSLNELGREFLGGGCCSDQDASLTLEAPDGICLFFPADACEQYVLRKIDRFECCHDVICGALELAEDDDMTTSGCTHLLDQRRDPAHD